MATITPSQLAQTYLDCIEHQILPLTVKGVDTGSKVFGAAILRKDDLKPVIVATNDEADCPLWHGEVIAIRQVAHFISMLACLIRKVPRSFTKSPGKIDLRPKIATFSRHTSLARFA